MQVSADIARHRALAEDRRATITTIWISSLAESRGRRGVIVEETASFFILLVVRQRDDAQRDHFTALARPAIPSNGTGRSD